MAYPYIQISIKLTSYSAAVVLKTGEEAFTQGAVGDLLLEDNTSSLLLEDGTTPLEME